MLNPFDYLYYKMYKISSYISYTKADSAGFMSILLSLNFFTLYILITGSKDTLTAFVFFLLVLSFLILVYWIFKREKKIIVKYKNESENSRIIGNTIVVCYVVLSIVLFILVVS